MERKSSKKPTSAKTRAQGIRPHNYEPAQSSQYGGCSDTRKRHKKERVPKTTSSKQSVDDYQHDSATLPHSSASSLLADPALSSFVGVAGQVYTYSNTAVDEGQGISTSLTDSMCANQGSGEDSSRQLNHSYSPTTAEDYDFMPTNDTSQWAFQNTGLNEHPSELVDSNITSDSQDLNGSNWNISYNPPPWNHLTLYAPRDTQDMQALFRSTDDLLPGDEASGSL